MDKKKTKTEVKKEEVMLRKAGKEKIIKEIEKKRNSCLYGIIKQYDFLVKNQTDKIQEKYKKKLERRLAKVNKMYDRKVNILIATKVYKRKVKEPPQSKLKIKQAAFSEVQKYAKLARADDKGYVLQVDTGERVHRSECDGGHIYPKKNYPQLAFNVNNIRPISKRGNKKQADNIADWIDKVPILPTLKNHLKEIAQDQGKKNEILSHTYYITQFELYRGFNGIERDRLGEHYSKPNT